MLWFALSVPGVAHWGWEQPCCVMVLEEAQQPILPPARDFCGFVVSPIICPTPRLGSAPFSIILHNFVSSWSSCPLLHLFLLCGVWRQQSFPAVAGGAALHPPAQGAPSLLQTLVTLSYSWIRALQRALLFPLLPWL